MLATLCVWFVGAPSVSAAGLLSTYLGKVQPSELFKGADRLGELSGEPPIAPVYRGKALAGYVYLNSDFTTSVGYSGKPIHIVVGIDNSGVIHGFKLVEHHEPIVLIGIPQAKVVAALNSIIGKDLGRVAAGDERPPQVDIVSGATVTVLVMSDSVVRSAVKLIRSGRLGENGASDVRAAPEIRKLDLSKDGTSDWETLIGDGSIRSLRLTVGEVSKAFADAKHRDAETRPETSNPADRFIDLYIAPVSVPAIGKTLLGEAAYQRLVANLKPGQSAILIGGDGAYSFKGSAYVRGGIFDRIELLQNEQGVRFRDRNHTRIAAFAPADAPHLKDIGLFVVPTDFAFDVTEPWELQLLVQRSVGARDKSVLPFNLGYSLPASYYNVTKTAGPEAKTDKPTAAETASDDQPLWMRI